MTFTAGIADSAKMHQANHSDKSVGRLFTTRMTNSCGNHMTVIQTIVFLARFVEATLVAF